MIDTQDAPQTLTGERVDLQEALVKQRFFLVNTLRGLSDGGCRGRPCSRGTLRPCKIDDRAHRTPP